MDPLHLILPIHGIEDLMTMIERVRGQEYD